jgi:molybdate transport system regulatory protein
MFGDKPGWGLKVRVWVERDGRKVLGRGRVELLGHIDRLHSIAAAAKQMHMSYRRAWSLVRDINAAAGEPLVEVTTGGPGGGGASLTPRGKRAVVSYERLVDRLTRAAGTFTGPPSRK